MTGALYFSATSAGPRHFACSGALIDTQVFLTAAHCFAGYYRAHGSLPVAWVTFDQNPTASSTFYSGTIVLDPNLPGPGQVLVEVRAAGIQPGEVMIRKGARHDRWPATFPSGQGSDLAGVVVEAGSQVRDAFRELERGHTRGKTVLRP